MVQVEFDGKAYSAASKHQKEWGGAMIDELTFRGDERVLDLGCGDGAITAQLADRVPQGQVVGIDSSPRMIETAQGHRRENLSFELMDINDVDFAEPFDLVFSNATLHWIHDHERLLRRVHGLLTPGGVIRFDFAAEGNCGNFVAVVRHVMDQERYAAIFSDFAWPWFMPSPAEYEPLVRAAGFQQIKVWGQNADRYFADADEMTRWLDQPSLIPILRVLPEHERAGFRQTAVTMMIQRTRQADGTCFETFRRINVLARK